MRIFILDCRNTFTVAIARQLFAGATICRSHSVGLTGVYRAIVTPEK